MRTVALALKSTMRIMDHPATGLHVKQKESLAFALAKMILCLILMNTSRLMSDVMRKEIVFAGSRKSLVKM